MGVSGLLSRTFQTPIGFCQDPNLINSSQLVMLTLTFQLFQRHAFYYCIIKLSLHSNLPLCFFKQLELSLSVLKKKKYMYYCLHIKFDNPTFSPFLSLIGWVGTLPFCLPLFRAFSISLLHREVMWCSR